MNKEQAKKLLEDESLLRQQAKVNITEKKKPVNDNRYEPEKRISGGKKDSEPDKLFEELYIKLDHGSKVYEDKKKKEEITVSDSFPDISKPHKYDTVKTKRTKKIKYAGEDKTVSKKAKYDTAIKDTKKAVFKVDEDKLSDVLIHKVKTDKKLTDKEIRQKAYFVSRISDNETQSRHDSKHVSDEPCRIRQRSTVPGRNRILNVSMPLTRTKYHVNRIYDNDQNDFDNDEITKETNLNATRFVTTVKDTTQKSFKAAGKIRERKNSSRFIPARKITFKQVANRADLINEQKRMIRRFVLKRQDRFDTHIRISLKDRIVSKIKRIARNNTTGLIITGVCLVFLIAMLSSAGIIFEGVSEATGVYLSGLSLSSDLDMTQCEEYFKKLEADLFDVTQNMEEYYPGYDRYILDFEGEIDHDALKLMAYLSSMYEDYGLSNVKSILNELFDAMYVVEMTEETQITDDDEEIKILTLKITKSDWDELMASRISDDKTKLYESYERSGGGHQAFLSPFGGDWSDHITSEFGWRIHPISGEERFHKGVDIGMPAGTQVLSCSEGIVIKSTYSEVEGNYVVVLDETGYKCHYMHLSERNVNEGDQVDHDTVIGKVGSTGYSTGPHLHLQITDQNNECLNPKFLVQGGY